MPLPPLPLSQTQRIAQKLLEFARPAGNQASRPAPCHAQSPPEPAPAKIRVVCISDTHCANPTVPDGDLLVHSGDMTEDGTFDEIQALLDWLKTLPHRHKVVIAGNHDTLLDAAFTQSRPELGLGPHDPSPGRTREDLDWGDVVYLENSAVTLTFKPGGEEGPDNDDPVTTTTTTAPTRTLKIFGSPLTPSEPGAPAYAFQYDPEDTDPWAGAVPDDADIVLSHGPPRFHLDMNRGCAHLLREVWRARPPLMVWGHVHVAHGEEALVFDPLRYWHMRAMTTGSWAALLVLGLHAVRARLGLFAAGGPEKPSGRGSVTHMVNAAIKSGNVKFDIINFEI